jgi:prepilin-type N-terminal cleavage/methylation domain-containing protein
VPGVERRGFTLVELVVALLVWAVVGTAAMSVMVAGQRSYRRQQELAEANATVRAATAILTGELRGSELLRGEGGSVTYRAFRNLYVTCRAADPARSAVVLRDDFLGFRPLDPQVDSILLFADGDPATGSNDRWIHADLREITAGPNCPDGLPGVTARLAGIRGRDIQAIGAGAPVRGTALWEIKRYRDARGEWWVGMRRYHKATHRWPAVQPVLGPIGPWGFELRFYDSAGLHTDAPDRTVSVILALDVPRKIQSGPHLILSEDGWLNLRVTLRNHLAR